MINFNLMQHHKYSLTEIENMIPFEREIYLSLLKAHIEEENQKAQGSPGEPMIDSYGDGLNGVT